MKLLYFAWVRQKVGTGEETREVPASITTVAQLASHLRSLGGGYAEAFADPTRLRAAVNQEHVSFDSRIGPDDEVAFFPPVTGG
jgi:molybdopterin synthase sulfur carrier subunit